MSFAQVVKTELISLETSLEEQKSELSALIKINGSLHFTNGSLSIQVTTENVAIARHMFGLVKRVYGLTCKITIKNSSFKSKNTYVLEIEQQVDFILDELELFDYDDASIHVLQMLETEQLKKAYLRGAFLASGSINDPKTAKYHFEVKDKNYAHALQLLELMNYFELNAKLIERRNHFVIYIKESEKIVEMLAYMHAIKALMFYEQIRLTRDIKNTTNRTTNCEQANYEKSYNAGLEQLEYIDRIERVLGNDFLDDKLQIVCEFRKKYPEYSLNELADVMSEELAIEITKSGLNHRFRKIKEIAMKIEINIEEEER